MKRSTKIALGAVALSFITILVGASGLSLYLFVNFLEAGRLTQQGYAALHQNDLNTALSRFDAASAKAFGRALTIAVRIGRGTAYNRLGRIDEAIRDFDKAIALNSTNPAARGGRGIAYHQKGDLDKALSDYSEAIRLKSDDRDVYYNRAVILATKAKHDEAIGDFSEAIYRDPDFVPAFIGRSAAYAASSHLDGAIASLDSALRIDPFNQEARAARGDLY